MRLGRIFRGVHPRDKVETFSVSVEFLSRIESSAIVLSFNLGRSSEARGLYRGVHRVSSYVISHLESKMVAPCSVQNGYSLNRFAKFLAAVSPEGSSRFLECLFQAERKKIKLCFILSLPKETRRNRSACARNAKIKYRKRERDKKVSILVSISVSIHKTVEERKKWKKILENGEQICIWFWSDDSTCNVEVWGSATTSHGKVLADLQKTHTHKNVFFFLCSVHRSLRSLQWGRWLSNGGSNVSLRDTSTRKPRRLI